MPFRHTSNLVRLMSGTRIPSTLAALLLAFITPAFPAPEADPEIKRFQNLFDKPDTAGAYAELEQWVFSPADSPPEIARRIDIARKVLLHHPGNSFYSDSNQTAVWIDPLLDRVERDAATNWRALAAAAAILTDYNLSHDGVLIDGVFQRARRSGGPHRYAEARDRIRAARFLQRAIDLCEKAGPASHDDLADLHLRLADSLEPAANRDFRRLTDLDTLPPLDTEEPRSPWSFDPEDQLIDGRSPVLGPDNEFLIPARPDSFTAAITDIGRVRWLIHRAASISTLHAPRAKLQLARLWSRWLGVEELVSAGYIYIEGTESEYDLKAPGEFEVHTLAGDETFVIGPDGPQRRKLPAELQFIPLFEQLIADPDTPDELVIDASDELFWILANRRQLDRGERLAHQLMRRLPENEDAIDTAENFLENLFPHGEFADTAPFAAGHQVTVDYFSFGLSELTLELWELDVDRVLDASRSSDHNTVLRFALSGSNQSLDVEDRAEFLSFYRKIKQWTAPIRQKPNGLQSRATLRIPVSEPGHYFLAARHPGGYRGVPILIEETTLVATPVAGDSFSFVLADASSGKPVAGAEILPLSDPDHTFTSDHAGFASVTDFEYQTEWFAILRPGRPHPEFKSTDYPRLTGHTDPDETESLLITNQPLYRPGQTVSFAGWLRKPNSRHPAPGPEHANEEVRIRVKDPIGRQFYERVLPLDEFRGFEGELTLDPDMVLGNCVLSIEDQGGNNQDQDPFDEKYAWHKLRLDWYIEAGEFRKPEFRVEIEADTDPGNDQFAATIRALYHSGDPVIGGKVEAEISAWPTNEILFPELEFDSLYDPGYDWPLPAARWLPDWIGWGISRAPFTDYTTDDYLSENNVTLSAEAVTDEHGEARVVFPKDLPLLDRFAYDCTLRAGVSEFSGRVAGATENFFFTDHPAELFLQPDKGFYQEGEAVTLHLRAFSTKGEPRSAKPRLRVARITYQGPGREVTETEFLSRPVPIDDSGKTTTRFLPPGPGQFLCTVEADGARRGFLLNVLADGFEARNLRFAPVQLTPERCLGAPGETIDVAIHCDRADAAVWLFQVMPDGSRQSPRFLQLTGKSTVVPVTVPASGSPDFVLMALTLDAGAPHTTLSRIAVPPRETFLDLSLKAAPEKAQPGDQATVDIRVADHLGRRAPASLAVTAYDRSLEDLAGPLPTTRRLLPDLLEIYEPFHAANQPEYSDSSPFHEIGQPGCFSERYDLSGSPRWQATSRFEKIGDSMWIGYEPPELPNSVGSSGGLLANSVGGIFPVTPATPTAYWRPRARNATLDAVDQSALKQTKARRHFADHAYWGTRIQTDARGHAQVDFPLPDNLTAWRVQAWALGHGNRFGDAKIEIPVSKPLQLRPVLPRSAVAGDQLEISATVRNHSEHQADLQVQFEIRGLRTDLPDPKTTTRVVTVPAGAEGLASWKVGFPDPGTAVFRFAARSTDGKLTDATELPLTIAARTTPVTVAGSTRLEVGATKGTLTLDLDAPPAAATLRLRACAHPALDAFAALPHLVDYPHGCTEQTLNRFLPLLVAWKATDQLGLDWEKMQKQFVVRDHSLGWLRGPARRSAAKKPANLSRERVSRLIYAGLHRLEDMQNPNDSWGWFPRGDGDPYLTALTIRGFTRARKLGFELPDSCDTDWLTQHARQRAKALEDEQQKFKPSDAFVAFVLSRSEEDWDGPLLQALLRIPAQLPLSDRIFLALALDPKDDATQLATLLPSIHTGIEKLNDHPRGYLNWWQDPVETRAWYLKLLARLDPRDPRIPDQIDRLLALRGDGILWKSTRDTALCIEAISETMPGFAKGGTKPQPIILQVEHPGGTESLTLERDSFWTGHATLDLASPQLASGTLPLKIRRSGDTGHPLHFSASLTWQADAATRTEAVAEGIEVRRTYYRRSSNGTLAVLAPGDILAPGELVEVELVLDAPQAREFIHLRDPLPAGLEPLHQLSGRDSGAYRESRLGETNFFLRRLSPWNNTLRYQLRAVTPGSCLALPARAECMYSPTVFGSSPPVTHRIRPPQ